MKVFRIGWLVVCAAAVLLYGWYRIEERRTLDTAGPMISFEEEELTVSIRDEEDALLRGVTAMDAKDGDVSDSLAVESISHFFTDKTRQVTYVAFDGDNHVTRKQRKIRYRDYNPPRFLLKRSVRIPAGESVNLTNMVEAYDCLDGDITGKLRVTAQEDYSSYTTGSYEVEFQVTNSAGDTSYLPLTLQVYDSLTIEARMLLSEYLVYYEGRPLDYLSRIQGVYAGGRQILFGQENTSEEGTNVSSAGKVLREETLEELVKVDDSAVNTAVPGIYPVYLTYKDEDYQGLEEILVVVEE